MVAAELVAETLPQELFRVAAPCIDRTGIGMIRIRAWTAVSSWPAVMNPCSRMRESTTWLRSTAPSRFVHGERPAGDCASPAISALSASVSCFAGFPNKWRDIVSTP